MLNPITKLADVLHLNVHLLSILKRLEIKLGFGDKTIDDICKENAIDPAFFIEIVRFFIAKEQFTTNSLTDFPVSTIVDYLRKTHKYYLNDRLPYIESLVEDLIRNNPNRDDIIHVKKFFVSYHEEFQKHILREEEDVFPYILTIEKAFNSNNFSDDIKETIYKNQILKYAQEHDNVDEKLNDLKNILIKYLPPLNNENLVYSILYELYDLERDVKDHSQIEDKIMVPRVNAIENQILQKSTEFLAK